MRPYLASSSGFQSYQYRCIEFALGNKNAAMLQPHAHRPDLLARVDAAWRAPSRSEEHTSELQSRLHLVCRLLLEKKKIITTLMSICIFQHSYLCYTYSAH